VSEKLIKSKNRVRDNWEVFTPDFIVQDMLNLVKNESERIDSTFLEPACWNWNFLIEILKRKMEILALRFKKDQIWFESQTLLAVGGIYWVDLMEDNINEARKRLESLVMNYYKKLFKKKDQRNEFILSLNYILERNLIQWNALTYTKDDWKPIVFAEWKLQQNKINRKDFSFEDLVEKENTNNKTYKKNDRWEYIFFVNDIHVYPPIIYLKLYQQDDYKPTTIQSWCIRRISESEQWWGFHSSQNSKWNARSIAEWNMVWLFD